MHYLVIDGNNLLHRAYWIAKHNNKEDTPLYIEILLKSIKLYMDMYSPDKIICTWDKKMCADNVKNFRQELCEYKQGRDVEYNAKVYEHIDSINRFLLALGVKIMYPGYLEADDIMHWLTTQHPDDKFTVVSVDKDILQLVSSNTVVYNPIKKTEFNVINFKSLTGIALEHFILQKAIIGDNSDNIKGIDGIGVKRVQKYILGEAKFTEEQQTIIDRNIKIIDLSQGWKVNEPREGKIYQKQFDLPWPNASSKAFFTLCMKNALYEIISKPEQFAKFFN